MKNIKIKSLIITAALLVAQGCTQDFELINTPPTSFSTIDPGIILSKSQKDVTFAEGFEFSNNVFGSWAQHWAGGVLIGSSRYIQQNDDYVWDSQYGFIRNISQVRNQILKGKEADPKGRTKLAIARIWETFIWQRMTDMVGDIPFSGTALGADEVNNQPKFDTQESIYNTLIKNLDTAIGQLNATDDSYGNADYFYKGNVVQWKKFANSLKLRLGMRIRYANPTLAQKVVTEAMGEALMASNADNAAVPTFNDATNSNVHPVLNHWLSGSPDIKYLAEALVTQLVATNDPRLPRLVQPTVNSVKAGKPAYKGLGVALTDAILKTIIKDDFSTASQTTFFNKAYSPAIPCLAMSFSDVSFYKAEAALEGWGATPDQAEKFYQDGVKAALAQNPYLITTVPADFAKELSFTGLTKEQKLEKIGTQKWIQLFGRSFEAHIEWKRMGYPALKPGPNLGTTNGTIPRRSIYTSREAILNKTNYDEASKRMANGDTYTSRVWWDKK